MIEKFKNYLLAKVKFSNEELDLGLSKLKINKLCENEHFLQAGDKCNKLAFVLEGLFKVYYIDNEGEEQIRSFIVENDFLASYTDMISDRESFVYIQALEDSIIAEISYESLKSLENEYYSWLLFSKTILEKVVQFKENRIREFLQDDAKQRYLNFKKKYPTLENRIKQYQVASYVGISPISLSRIRKEMGY